MHHRSPRKKRNAVSTQLAGAGASGQSRMPGHATVVTADVRDDSGLAGTGGGESGSAGG